MCLIQISRREKYLQPDCLSKLVSMSLMEQHQAVRVDRQDRIESLKCGLKQPNLSAKWHITKILPTDVETEHLNDHIDYLTKSLNKYRKFSQIFNCDFSYLNSLSKLKLQYFNCGS